MLEKIASKLFLERLQELINSDPMIATLSYMLNRKQLLEWAFSIGITTDKGLRSIVSPIPPVHLRSITAAAEQEIFLWTGAFDTDLLVNLFRENGYPADKPGLRVLDFGCGCGRMTRYLSMDENIEAYGSDVNNDLVVWCQENLKGVTTVKNDTKPPLPFEDHFFDCIYTLSIFSHLDELSSTEWIIELSRLLRPGGLLALTTHGYPALNIIRDSSLHQSMFRVTKEWANESLSDLKDLKFMHLPYDKEILVQANAGESYGNTFVHPEKVSELCASSSFELVQHLEGGLRGWQDIYLIRKKD